MARNPADAPNWTPSKWMNRSMTVMLKTPGLQRLVGKSTALLTFIGRKSGNDISMPVSYVEIGDRILISGHRTRQWWRNLVVNPSVELRLAGKVRLGTASVMDDPDNALSDFIAFLHAQPVVARINEIPIEYGKVDEAKAREVLSYTVLVSIKLDEDQA